MPTREAHRLAPFSVREARGGGHLRSGDGKSNPTNSLGDYGRGDSCHGAGDMADGEVLMTADDKADWPAAYRAYREAKKAGMRLIQWCGTQKAPFNNYTNCSRQFRSLKVQYAQGVLQNLAPRAAENYRDLANGAQKAITVYDGKEGSHVEMVEDNELKFKVSTAILDAVGVGPKTGAIQINMQQSQQQAAIIPLFEGDQGDLIKKLMS